MDDDHEFYDRFREILQEVPEAEDALRVWRDRQAMATIRRDLSRRSTEILVKSLCGYEPPGDKSGGAR